MGHLCCSVARHYGGQCSRWFSLLPLSIQKEISRCHISASKKAAGRRQSTIEEQTHCGELHDYHRHTKAARDPTSYFIEQKEKDNPMVASCTGFVMQKYDSISYWVPSGVTRDRASDRGHTDQPSKNLSILKCGPSMLV